MKEVANRQGLLNEAFRGVLAKVMPISPALFADFAKTGTSKRLNYARRAAKDNARETMLENIAKERVGRKQRSQEVYGTPDKWRSIPDTAELRRVGFLSGAAERPYVL